MNRFGMIKKCKRRVVPPKKTKRGAKNLREITGENAPEKLLLLVYLPTGFLPVAMTPTASTIAPITINAAPE